MSSVQIDFCSECAMALRCRIADAATLRTVSNMNADSLFLRIVERGRILGNLLNIYAPKTISIFTT